MAVLVHQRSLETHFTIQARAQAILRSCSPSIAQAYTNGPESGTAMDVGGGPVGMARHRPTVEEEGSPNCASGYTVGTHGRAQQLVYTSLSYNFEGYALSIQKIK